MVYIPGPDGVYPKVLKDTKCEIADALKTVFNLFHILQIGTRNQKFDYEMNGTKLESVQCVKDLGLFRPHLEYDEI